MILELDQWLLENKDISQEERELIIETLKDYELYLNTPF